MPTLRLQPWPTAIEDRWILSRLARIDAVLSEQIARFEFAQAARSLYDFVYGELCDWYIELVKARLGEEALDSTLRYLLRETLQICHPLLPFVTEELWSYAREPGEGLLAGVVRTLSCPTPRCSTPMAEHGAWSVVIEATQAVARLAQRGGRRAGGVGRRAARGRGL